jgi:hypothetical protein
VHPWKSSLDRAALLDSDRLFSYLEIDNEGNPPDWDAGNRTSALFSLEFDIAWIAALNEREAPAPREVVSTIIRHVALGLAPLSVSSPDLYTFESVHEALTDAFLSEGLGPMLRKVESLAEVLEKMVAKDLLAWREKNSIKAPMPPSPESSDEPIM